MKTLLFYCLLVLLIVLPAYILYWKLFRPVLIERLKYRLFQVRDDLRLLLIQGEIGEKEKAYPLIEVFCNKAISHISAVDLSTLVMRKSDQRGYLEAKRDLEIIFNAGAPVRKLFLEAMSSVFGAAIANSPGVIILVAPVFIFTLTALWFGKVKAWFVELFARAVGNLCFTPS